LIYRVTIAQLLLPDIVIDTKADAWIRPFPGPLELTPPSPALIPA